MILHGMKYIQEYNYVYRKYKSLISNLPYKLEMCIDHL